MAGALTSLAFVACSFVDFAQRTETFQASTAALQELKEKLDEAEEELQGSATSWNCSISGATAHGP